jgi:hypothetical protein
MSASPVGASTLNVHCGGKVGLTSIGAALKTLQFSSSGPSTINVTGTCNQNVVIQGLDRLTLNAAPGASINDASGGNLDVIDIRDSRDVSINNFTVTGGAFGINCLDHSLCRLNGDIVQGANTTGVGVFFSGLDVTGGVLQNNPTGLQVYNGSEVKAMGVTIQNNDNGVDMRSAAFLNTDAVISGNSASGVFASHNATLNCIGCQVNGNGIVGIVLRRNSTARIYADAAITGNSGGGVLVSEESSAYFPSPINVTGNTGGLDVACANSATTAKFATTNIGGGSTNCVEPVDP